MDMDASFIEDLTAILEADPEELDEEYILHSENWNSLSIVSAIVLIDEHFGVSIEGEKLRQCTTLGELWSLIQTARNKGS